MRLISPSEIKEIDNYCNSKGNLPFNVLMERAGNAFFREINKVYPNLSETKFLVLCGKGNNGGDGLVTAGLLKKSGALADVLELEHFTGEMPDFSEYDCILDCIFGTGFHGELSPEISALTKAVNDAGKMIISADIPSGVNGLTGEADINAVRADITVAFCGAKPGHGIYPGRTNTGKLIVREIGIPEEIVDRFATPYCEFFTAEERTLHEQYILPERERDTHKGSFGKVGIIAGCKGMCGAAALTAEAALRMGAGLVYSFVPEEILHTMELLLKENVKLPVKGFLPEKEIIDYILNKCQDMGALVIGPGLGQFDETKAFVKDLLKALSVGYNGRVVLDADGINAFTGETEILKEILKTNGFGKRVLITPHPAEFSRITGYSMSDVKFKRVLLAKKAAKEFGCSVLLKGASTITASPDGRYTINGTGNPGMATAGSGDVLSGIAGALSVRMNSYDAGRYGAYYHGILGDDAAKREGEYGMIAGDMLK